MTDLSKVVSTGVGPIIVISACGLLCLALYNRMAAVVTRVRSYQRELLSEEFSLRELAERKNESGSTLKVVRHEHVIAMLRVQIDRISGRARLLRRALFSLLMSVLLMSLCALLLGLSVLLPGLVAVAATFFALGIASMCVAVVFAMVELTRSLDPMLLEAASVLEFTDVLHKPDSVDREMRQPV
ncbi:MAG: DUF2721 domain-containing protein [Tepidisphaeraceae bacterium]